MGKAENIAELQQQITNQVFGQFSGMDNEYKRLINKYYEVESQRGKFTQEHINEQQLIALSGISALQADYGEKAMEQLETLEREYSVTKNPTEEPTDTQERLLYEIQRMNNMKLIEAKLQVADTDTLKEMYDENKDDADFLTLLNVKTQNLSESNKVLLEGHIKRSKENPFLDEINKMKYTFKTLINSDMYPSRAETGVSGVKFRSVASDLKYAALFQKGWE